VGDENEGKVITNDPRLAVGVVKEMKQEKQ